MFDTDCDGYLSIDELSDILFKKGKDKLCEDDRTEVSLDVSTSCRSKFIINRGQFEMIRFWN